MAKLDIPPAWLVLFLAATWGLARLVPALTYEFAWQGTAALIFFLAALLMMALGIVELKSAKTPIQPGAEPTALVTSGIFRRSRNPMYFWGLVGFSCRDHLGRDNSGGATFVDVIQFDFPTVHRTRRNQASRGVRTGV